MLKDGISQKWKIKKFPVKRNIAELLLLNIKKWQQQSYVYQQLQEFKVIFNKSKPNSDLFKMNDLLQQAAIRPIKYIEYQCYTYQCCMQLMMDIPEIKIKKSIVFRSNGLSVDKSSNFQMFVK